MKLAVQAGTTDFTLLVWLGDSSATDGSAQTGVAYDDITVYYARVETDNDVTSAVLTMSALANLIADHADGGWYQVDATNQPGLYRLDLSDAILAAGAWSVVVTIIDAGANDIAPANIEIQLVAYDPYDAVRMGLTALPNAAADAGGGLPISDAGGLDLDALNTAAVRLTAARVQVLDDWINAGRLDLILDIIAADVVNLDGAVMRGTDSAALAATALTDATWTDARAGYLDELAAANIPADLDAVLTDTVDMQPLIEKMAYVGPSGLGVWIDDGAANTNTVLGTDGSPDNPVSTIAAATTIATSLGSQRFYLVNDTQITLAQPYEGYEFVGIGVSNLINLGSQDVDNTLFRNVILTGTQGGTQFMRAIDCQLQAILSAEILADDCWLTGDITLRAATNQSFGQCKSGVPGNATPDLTFPGSGTTSVNFRHYSGGLTVMSATSLDTMSYEADGQLIIDATCTSLAITVRGNCTITDNGTTTSLTQDAAVNRTNINAEVDTALADYDAVIPADLNDPTAAAIRTEIDSNSTQLAAIVADTNELQTDDIPGTLVTIAGYLDTEIAAILADTNELQTDWANGGRLDLLIDSIVTATVGAIAEITGVSDIPSTPTIKQAIMLRYMMDRNAGQSTATERRVMNDAGTEILDAVMSDDATTFDQGELGDA